MEEILSRDRLNQICNHLEKTAYQLGMTLRKNRESVETLEDILLGLRELGDDEALKGGIFMSGIYLGEILLTALDGLWTFSSEKNQFALTIGGDIVYPIERVQKFVNNPEQEGLAFYANAIMAKYR